MIQTTPGVQPVPVYYPRPVATVDRYLASIQVPAGTHPVWLVVVLSILFGGWAGMLVNRQYVKGIVYGLILGAVLGFATCGIGFMIWYPLTLVDAILVAVKLNQGRAIKEWEYF